MHVTPAAGRLVRAGQAVVTAASVVRLTTGYIVKSSATKFVQAAPTVTR